MVGLQETTAEQLAGILTARATGRYAAYPDPGTGDLNVESSLVWDTRRFEATRKMTIRTQFIARVLPRPIVKLRHRVTGRQICVMDVHNAPWDYQRKRNQATKVQIEKIAELRDSGLARVLHRRHEREAHHPVQGAAAVPSCAVPYGGRLNGEGECINPRRRMRVDWIFGSKFVKWSGFSYSKPPLVSLVHRPLGSGGERPGSLTGRSGCGRGLSPPAACVRG